MSQFTEKYLEDRQKLIDANAYDPRDEHDACGVGLIVALDGQPRREIVEKGVRALKAVYHRGAVDADGKTGDGAGIRVDVPQDFFKEQVARTGHDPSRAPICVGQIFLPRTDLIAQEAARTIVEAEILKYGFYIYGWRQPPIDPSIIGQKANDTRPEIEQVLFYDAQDRSRAELERTLYICRRRIERRAREASIPSFYVCSLSQRNLIYKGMFLAEDIDNFYPDLKDERFVSAVCIYHQRYSTNTFPQWWLAQPFRMLAHNGEINTVRGNENWMKSHEIRMVADAFEGHENDLKPVISAGSSDSAALDSVFEILVKAGRSAPMAKALLMPEAWSKRDSVMPDDHAALYSYANSVMEPWDGPAAIAAFDGRWAIAGLDRNGLRPMRYALTRDNILAVGSESGMCPLDEEDIVRKGRVRPGGMIAADIQENKFYEHNEIVSKLADKHPYLEWLENVKELEPMIGPGEEPAVFETDDLRRRKLSAGFSMEDIELILAPMVEDAKEAIGSMGDDAPPAVISDVYRPLSHFFRQNFSQVTNPPIDPLREDRVMSLKTRFKNLGNILISDSTQTDVFVLESPVLTNGMYKRFRDMMGDRVCEIDCSFIPPGPDAHNGEALRACLDRIQQEAEDAVRSGHEHVVLTDEYQGSERVACPMILAAGAVQAHLVKQGLRSFCSITVRSAECLDTHYFAVLVGVGATCVNAYLAQDCITERHAKGLFGDLPINECVKRHKAAIEGGLLKILSKMGISVISSYRGGYNFEALGLSRALVAEYFPGMTSRISGIGLAGLEKKAIELHDKAFNEDVISLPIGGFYRIRRNGERHALDGKLIHQLQSACDTGSYARYKAFSQALRDNDPVQLRDLLDFKPAERSVPLDEVQSINEIRKRFLTPGMSLGALSPEAHGALNIAMNRIGAKSVSGEGGEDRARYKPLPNGDNPNSAVKQVASGRFGVTAEYLNQCREIEIKVAQGAKPGEGGQLPGFKVTEMIARFRNSTPGVTLISPPPHHDIYSIEDLAQLIYDLKQINPIARVCVKLVARSGVGTIAAGVAKAKADVILIAGNVGGTGASPQTSIKFAGLPWEIGLAEAHQVLSLNNLRDQVTLRTDGGLRTGRDIVMAAMLGAEEYGIGTASLVAMGCIMVRQCHSNTCPVGVCTQREDLRQKFTGTPDKVVNLMSFIAEEVREILAELGFTSLDEVIGRTDLLSQVSRGAAHLDDLDLNPLLVKVEQDKPISYKPNHRNEVADTLDHQILRDAQPFFERGEKMQLAYGVKNVLRAIGTRASSEIVRQFGNDAIPEHRLWISLRGSAGQSLGAFAVKGLTLEVTGDSNDYVGKGLSGATIILRPFSHMTREAATNTIIGNTCLYGATSGNLFAAGQAAERFAVRNSGATAVIEGCGSNGCEYMTGGKVAILGEVGDNFGAGMSGGMAFIYDPDNRFEKVVNPDSVGWYRIQSAHWEGVLKGMIEEHVSRTDSRRAMTILDQWDIEKEHFWQIVPHEMKDRLDNPISEAAVA
ncbi:glutamate synthase large subunit [Ponticaulis sp.]|uniref:glutamate synthase large subunit n=1 Tax=Ponticaulis sp. TaxID=2020902 RepID=UPI000B6D4BF9|nr:glutamate synthase large subunit [Ponticaulis sp.]MAI91666.1 glutamate synthase large subunit [Ponticaulis sp.]OUX97231.1 MAG: glutamate synthase large subunit [Hyphomonadaceae bacterium TMED5]